ncbi:glycerol kinase GlpK [Zavarzinia sp. CC-PAN008]|uniref:glycerol kinase GlpK n=1 Tax=Zavarzinia sp. CC-PAN008 TaxID=3243332 RepID=UPI003F74678A
MTNATAQGSYILAIDQGTTSTRAVLYDAGLQPLGEVRRDLTQSYPADGWVEHDADEIWQASLFVVRSLIARFGVDPAAIAAIGITNQRETTVLWDRATGRPVAPAIVWQDRRTAALCERLRGQGAGPLVAERTGLVIDPYFSGTKIAWLLDHVDGARDAAARGALAFGTIDSFLLWRLTGGRVHATDATNASRTLLFDVRRQAWDPELLHLLDVPAGLLPQVRDTVGDFGACDPALFGAAIPIRALAGDQQAAAFGQACLAPGRIKATYGTGCFVVANTGETLVRSAHQLLGTVAWRIAGQPAYALEGSIFVAGAAVQWLRDGLKLFPASPDIEGLAAQANPQSQVVLVPAFTGLGAPYWNAGARGAMFGLTRDTGVPELARATLEANAFQTWDLIEAFAADLAAHGLPMPDTLRVDGGMVANGLAMQILADLTGLVIERPRVTETTAFGAAAMAGLGAGLFDTTDAVAARWQLDRRFEPAMPADERDARRAAWHDAIRRVQA